MAKLKVVEDVADSVPAPQFTPAPTRKQNAGWTAERQRKFIEHLSLTGNVGEACALVGVSSSSAYRLRNKAGAESFARAWDSALALSPTRLSSIALDRAINAGPASCLSTATFLAPRQRLTTRAQSAVTT